MLPLFLYIFLFYSLYYRYMFPTIVPYLNRDGTAGATLCVACARLRDVTIYDATRPVALAEPYLATASSSGFIETAWPGTDQNVQNVQNVNNDERGKAERM